MLQYLSLDSDRDDGRQSLGGCLHSQVQLSVVVQGRLQRAGAQPSVLRLLPLQPALHRSHQCRVHPKVRLRSRQYVQTLQSRPET